MSKQMTFMMTPPPRLCHGGELAKGKRKVERPLKMKKPIHVVLRAKRSGLTMKERGINRLLQNFAARFGIKIYRHSVNSNHIHILLVTRRRKDFQDFLRTVTGLTARMMGGKFWAYLAFSRVANWGKEFKVLDRYVRKNILEAAGLISYTPRTG